MKDQFVTTFISNSRNSVIETYRMAHKAGSSSSFPRASYKPTVGGNLLKYGRIEATKK